MVSRRIFYVVLVGTAVLFQIFFRFYLSTFVLVLILVLPVLSLLLSMPGSVSDVARLLGYPNVYQFGVIFKRLTGMSPREFKVAQN